MAHGFIIALVVVFLISVIFAVIVFKNDKAIGDFIKDMFSSNSDVSSTRVCMVFLVIVSGVVAVLSVWLGRSGGETAALVGALLTPTMLGKSVQKFAEVKKTLGGDDDSSGS